MNILVSAGHTNVAGKDRGAEGNGFIEGVEAVKIRDRVAERLRAKNLQVIEDGADGVNEPLTKAVALARTAQTAVEFHFNAGSPQATGIEVLAKPKHKKLAQSLANAIAKSLGLKLRGDAGYKADNSGQHHRLAFCEAGGLIVEVCFISNPNDMTAYKHNFHSMCANLADVLATETPTTSIKPTFKDLEIGAKGEAVRALQMALHNKNFLKSSDIDGDFGRITRNAVFSFQRAYGLEADGIVGLNTAKALGI